MPKTKGEVKTGTHLVLKMSEINAVGTLDELQALERICKKVGQRRQAQGKNPDPKYLVVNHDEHYADDVWDVISKGEGI
jgi:hypothetical protein